MTKAKFEALGGGRFRVSGVLDAHTVAAVLKESRERFASVTAIDIDMGGVSDADSAGLALLIEWLRCAQQSKKPIHFSQVPAQISALARISEVEDLLTANGVAPAPEEAQGTGAA